MTASSHGYRDRCGYCRGLWKPSMSRDRMQQGDAGRSWLVTNTAIFAAIRFFMAFVGVTYLVYSAATDKAPPPHEEGVFGSAWNVYWKFYTHWTLALVTFYYMISCLFSYSLWKSEQKPISLVDPLNWNPDSGNSHHDEQSTPLEEFQNHGEDATAQDSTTNDAPENEVMESLRHSHRHHRHHRVSFGELCLWLAYQTTWASSMFLGWTFWLLIGFGCIPKKSCSSVDSHFWSAHLLNVLLLSVELFLNKIPFIPVHSIVTLLYAILWLIFSVILWYVTGQWIYPQSQKHGQLWSALTFWPGWIALNVVSFFICMLIDWIITRLSSGRKHTFLDTNLSVSHHRRRSIDGRTRSRSRSGSFSRSNSRVSRDFSV